MNILDETVNSAGTRLSGRRREVPRTDGAVLHSPRAYTTTEGWSHSRHDDIPQRESSQVPTERIGAIIDKQIRDDAVSLLQPGETLTGYIEEALRRENERRKAALAAPAPRGVKLPRGKRPKRDS